jgi:hypothetical protein
MIYPIKLISKNRNTFLESISIKTWITLHIFNFRSSSSHVRPDVGGLILKEEKVEQEVSGGPQATSFEELNPEQGKPRCI